MKKKVMAIIMLFIITVANIWAQWDDGILLDVSEVDVEKLKSTKLTGAEAVLMIMEKFADESYNYAYLSPNYTVPEWLTEYLKEDKGKFTVGLVSFPKMNKLLYAHVVYGKYFFILALAKKTSDIKTMEGVQMIRLNYEKRNRLRRENLIEAIEKNNLEKMGIRR